MKIFKCGIYLEKVKVWFAIRNRFVQVGKTRINFFSIRENPGDPVMMIEAKFRFITFQPGQQLIAICLLTSREACH